MLGVLPTQRTIVLERFFDESGGMQLVIHAPFGSRSTGPGAWRCASASAGSSTSSCRPRPPRTALLLSLGPQHSFPLADVFRYLSPASVRDMLVQALLDAPVRDPLAVERDELAGGARSRGGGGSRRSCSGCGPDDLLAAAFPDAAACLENIPGDREIPDHPLVKQTVLIA